MRASASRPYCFTRPTTPTIVSHGDSDLASPNLIRRPIGIFVRQDLLRHVVVDDHDTRRLVRVELVEEPAAQQRDLHRLEIAAGGRALVRVDEASPGGGVRPSTVIGPHAKNWLIGSELTPPDPVTPGSRSRRSHSSRYSCPTAWAFVYFGPITASSAVSTRSALNPGARPARVRSSARAVPRR